MKKIIVIFIIITSLFSGCIRPLLRKVGMIDNKATLKKIKFDGKDILFLPLVHISQQPFYDSCKKLIGSLSNKGYYIFGEGIGSESILKGEKTESYQDTIYMKKIRKIVGIDIAHYQKTEFFVKFSDKYNLVVQPKDLYPKEDPLGKGVDYTTKQLIEVYEKTKGEVILNDYDKNTKIGEEYKGEKMTRIDKDNEKYFLNEVSVNKRNEYIVEEVRKSVHNKILLVYGSGHYDGLKQLLENGKTK